MQIDTSWKLRRIDEITWNKLWSSIEYPTLLQCIAFGKAKKDVEKWQPVLYEIIDHDNIVRGVIQVLVKRIKRIVKVARVNRGPLFLNISEVSLIPDIYIYKTFEALKNEANKLGWSYLRVAPELNYDQSKIDLLKDVGFSKVKNAVSGGSLKLNLDMTENYLFNNLQGKWRNLLRKAMKLEVKIDNVDVPKNIDLVTKKYEEFKESKNFTGISSNILKSLSESAGKDFIILTASVGKSSEPESIVVGFRHGNTVTYLIGVNSDIGRKNKANYLLLWELIIYSKRIGCKYFDLGGLDDTTPKGIAHFKRGTNAKQYNLIGEWFFIGGVLNILSGVFR